MVLNINQPLFSAFCTSTAFAFKISFSRAFNVSAKFTIICALSSLLNDFSRRPLSLPFYTTNFIFQKFRLVLQEFKKKLH